MTIWAAPGATFEASAEGAATGLVGTIGVRIRNPVTAADFLARTTAGITEQPSGSGIYFASLTAPSTGGTYAIVWDDGTTFASEDLIVTSTAPVPSVTTGIDLTTLAIVRSALNIPVADTDRDGDIQDQITAASAHLIDAYNREFAPAGTVASARRFTYRGGGILDLSPFNAQVGEITGVSIDADQTSPTVLVANTDWSPMPAYSSDGVIDYLRLPTQQSANGQIRYVDVTAKWGYPAVPTAVATTCRLVVMDWYRRDASRPSGFTAGDEDPTVSDVAIPQRARWIMRSYERPPVV